jgi:bifunctional N-acetylglucosamine-1-phosphate-uridyltransferase/glucosamine-1-phosphate-acetyltransferase GlmU-like protein
VFLVPGSTIITCFFCREAQFARVLDAGKAVGILASLIISETEVEDLATVAAQETCDKGVEEGQTAVSFGPQSESRPSG